MAEPVTVVWWTADSPLFESIVHPGPDEAFMALYPLRPAPDQRATLVAVVGRDQLPTPRGMTIGHQEGRTVTVEPRGEPEVLDLSTPAPPNTRTPPWDLMPRDRWVIPGPTTMFDGCSRTQQITFLVGLIAMWLVVTYHRVLDMNGGDVAGARQVTVGIPVALACLTGLLVVIDRIGPREKDEAEPRVRFREVDRRRLARRGPR